MGASTRRGFLRTSGGLGLAAGLSEQAKSAPEPAQGGPLGFPVIDTHIHVVHSRLTEAAEHAPIDPDDPLDRPPAERAAIIRREMEAAGVEHTLGMPRRPGPDDPLGIRDTLELAALVPGLHPVGIADPRETSQAHLDRVEAALTQGVAKAFKAYLGYLHFGPDSPGYGPYYELAARYGVPFIFHTGDTYSHTAKLKYAHPLLVDEVAVDHPKVRFVMAHLGNPWLPDAAEVVYKNNKPERANVWTDLSGFLVGTAEQFREYGRRGILKTVAADIRKAFDYAEQPGRFLYGSDWPLAPMATYLEFLREAIPEEHRRAVFRDNARELFGL
jgi:predicted TIM-barrel fold metal-dependent hydrolase